MQQVQTLGAVRDSLLFGTYIELIVTQLWANAQPLCPHYNCSAIEMMLWLFLFWYLKEYWLEALLSCPLVFMGRYCVCQACKQKPGNPAIFFDHSCVCMVPRERAEGAVSSVAFHSYDQSSLIMEIRKEKYRNLQAGPPSFLHFYGLMLGWTHEYLACFSLFLLLSQGLHEAISPFFY